METNLWLQFDRVALAAQDQPAFLQGERVLSFSDLRNCALAGAGRLGALGLAPGDRCVIWAGNSIEMAAAVLGVVAVGAIPVFVNSDAPISHFGNAIRLTEARHAVADQTRLRDARFDGVSLNIGSLAAAEATGDANARTGRVVGPDDPASILFTSGSSGLPKGVTQSHKNLLWGCGTLEKLLNFTSQDRILCGIPWSFDYGWGQLLSTLLLGITQILPDGRGATKFCDAIVRHQPTILPGVPSLFADLIMGLSPIREIDRSSVRLITNTGSKIPSALLAEILDLFPDAELSLNYGLTETYRSTSLPVGLGKLHPDSVGYAIPGVAIHVVKKDGQEARNGEVGEIIHQGGGVFMGYWGEPERTRKTRRDAPVWCNFDVQTGPVVYTGDLGWKDEKGLLYIKGRKDRQIKSMGVRVSPDEIENLIETSGLVQEVAIIPRNHHTVGQQVVAVVAVKTRRTVSTRDLRKMARETMSPHMQPMDWVIVDSLPRTPHQKVDYVALIARFANEATQ